MVGSCTITGLIPLAMSSLFEHIENEQKNSHTQYTVNISAVEISNDMPTDLLLSKFREFHKNKFSIQKNLQKLIAYFNF